MAKNALRMKVLYYGRHRTEEFEGVLDSATYMTVLPRRLAIRLGTVKAAKPMARMGTLAGSVDGEIHYVFIKHPKTGRRVRIEVWVPKQPTREVVLLGRDFMQRAGVVLDFRRDRVRLNPDEMDVLTFFDKEFEPYLTGKKLWPSRELRRIERVILAGTR